VRIRKEPWLYRTALPVARLLKNPISLSDILGRLAGSISDEKAAFATHLSVSSLRTLWPLDNKPILSYDSGIKYDRFPKIGKTGSQKIT
jgi:hypothetical protein